MSRNTEKPEPDSVDKKNKPRRFARFVFHSVAFVLTWWFISSIFTAVPSPLETARVVLVEAESVTNDLYYALREADLEEKAERVRREAETISPEDDSAFHAIDTVVWARFDSLPWQEHMRRLRRGDSIVQSQLRGISSAPALRGRVVNVLLVGVDSRLGSRSARADAIHLLSIQPDSGIIEILSIPRDTYYDLGFPDTTNFNILANARAGGIRAFMRRVDSLVRRGPIRYYVEVGFSQVMGILEILGYRNAVETLQFLRTRKGLPAGDVQRSHNQALFIKKTILDNFHLAVGAGGELLVAAGLQLVRTNLTFDVAQGLIYALAQTGFPLNRPEPVRVRMLPMYRYRLKDMWPDSLTVSLTLARARERAHLPDSSHAHPDVQSRLRHVLSLAVADTARPWRVISRLEVFFNQRAWLQVRDLATRITIRDSIVELLSSAYRRRGKEKKAEEVIAVRDAENYLYRIKQGRSTDR